MSVRIFEGSQHAKTYAQFRTVLPDKVIEEILDFLCEMINPHECINVFDVGCGNGQSSIKFSSHFKNVYAFDVSEAQISEAKRTEHPMNVHFNVSEVSFAVLILKSKYI